MSHLRTRFLRRTGQPPCCAAIRPGNPTRGRCNFEQLPAVRTGRFASVCATGGTLPRRARRAAHRRLVRRQGTVHSQRRKCSWLRCLRDFVTVLGRRSDGEREVHQAAVLHWLSGRCLGPADHGGGSLSAVFAAGPQDGESRADILRAAIDRVARRSASSTLRSASKPWEPTAC